METVKETGGRALEALVALAEMKMRLLALKGADKSSRLATSFLTIVILTIIFIFSVSLLNIGLAILLSLLLHKLWIGFFIVGAFYVIGGIVLVALRKKIIFEPLLNAIVNALVGAELKAEESLEKAQDKVEDNLNLEKQPDTFVH